MTGALVGVLVLSGCAGNVDFTTSSSVSSPSSFAEKLAVSVGEQFDSAIRSDTLAVGPTRESGHVVAAGIDSQGGGAAPYNYGPSVMVDGANIGMWWCSQYSGAGPDGDDILYAALSRVDEKLSLADNQNPSVALSGNLGEFDAKHTCDPSVIYVDGSYYLYYTGAAGDHALGNAIGLATSTDGRTWQRMNNGKAILGPAEDIVRENAYGAGQPAALYLDGWFYLMFTDTSGQAAGTNGAGQFVLRARDAAFTQALESLSSAGFVPSSGTNSARTHSIADAFSADFAWSAPLNAFVIAHQTYTGTTFTFWNKDFSAKPYPPVVVPGQWQEGPGLVRNPAGHLPAKTTSPCEIPIDIVRATTMGAAGAPTDLRHYGVDVASQHCLLHGIPQ